MIQRIITALVLIPLVLLLILRAPIWLLAIVAGIVALLAIREFLELTRHYGVEPFTVGTFVYVGFFFAVLAVYPPHDKPLRISAFIVFSGLLAVLAPFLFLTVAMKRQKLASAFPAAAASVFAILYVAIPLGMLVDMRRWPEGGLTLIYLMLVVWSGDIFAYFVGKTFGRHKMAPRISPGKTWEGAAASMFASVGVGLLLSLFWGQKIPSLFQNYPTFVSWGMSLPILAVSALLNIAAQLGDLVESAIKRGADVKDSGTILPGHGGMLDRIDALLFAAPVLWISVAGRILLFP